MFVYGVNVINEALLTRNAKELVRRILITKDNADVLAIAKKAATLSIPVETCSAKELSYHLGVQANHQGVAALIEERLLYQDLEKVIKKNELRKLFLLVDELEDPQNVGAIIRSAHAFNVSAVLIPEHHEVKITGASAKVSSGAVFHVPLVRIGNINSTLLSLKKAGFWIYGLDKQGTTTLPHASFDQMSVLIIGNEGEGMREKTRLHCDFLLSVPINPSSESLNASAATAVALYEWSSADSR